MKSRRVAVPAVLGVSAVAAMAYGATSASAGESHRAAQAQARSQVNPTVADTPTMGCSISDGSSSPDYGCGKVTVEAKPVAGTYPTASTPDPSGLQFVITGPMAFNDAVIQGATATCTTGTGGTDGESCEDSGEASAPDPTNSAVTDNGTWVAGDPYSVAFDTASGSPAAPANSLIPPITGTFPDCTAYNGGDGTNWPGNGTSSGCPDTTIINLYGTYHQVGLHVVNSVTHKAIAKASYDLCTATSGAPKVGTTTCPTGSSVVATATTSAAGTLVFPDVYLGSSNYSVVPTHEPTGYQAAKSQRLEVPVVTKVTEAGTLYQSTVQLTPVKTVAATHHVTTKAGTAKKINAFAGAGHVVGKLTLVKVGKPKHGKVRHSGGTITYTPAAGFTGKDTFTYTIRNSVGATSTGKVVVLVKPKRHKG